MKFHATPTYPAKIRAKEIKLDKVRKRQGRVYAVMDRLGHGRNERTTKRYICEEEDFHHVKKPKKFTFNGKDYTFSYNLIVPSAAGPESTKTRPTTLSGRDRVKLNI